jgi:DNA ligase 1
MPRYEYRDDKSNKFWDIALEGNAYTVTYGAIGTAGKTLRKELRTAEEAQAQSEKQVASKLREGYVLAGQAAAAPPPPAAAQAAPAAGPAAGPRDLADGESVQVKGSGSRHYVIKNTGGVYACSCPAWRNQSLGIEKRSCKHIQALRGAEQEEARVGAAGQRRAVGADGKPAGPKSGPPPLLLAETWAPDADMTGWWMSEKLDGVRAYWNGRTFLSRLGNELLAPEWFVAALPAVPLDGELWCGRKKFQQTLGIVRRQDRNEAWQKVRFLVFDAPAHAAAFEERMVLVRQSLEQARPPYAGVHEHQRCEGLEHLKAELARVEAVGGEGLMLRRPGSAYEVGRSSTLLKVKSFRDAEAQVIGYVAGAGRHKGRIGALRARMPDGTEFSVGTGLSDAERDSPPAIGSVITYRYQELSDGGVPRFPAYIGVRLDL